MNSFLSLRTKISIQEVKNIRKGRLDYADAQFCNISVIMPLCCFLTFPISKPSYFPPNSSTDPESGLWTSSEGNIINFVTLPHSVKLTLSPMLLITHKIFFVLTCILKKSLSFMLDTSISLCNCIITISHLTPPPLPVSNWCITILTY